MTMRRHSCVVEEMPKCPICGGLLLPMQFECPDGSGWVYGWGCDCTETLRENYEGQEIILKTISDKCGVVRAILVRLS